jgi:hypothetical protein
LVRNLLQFGHIDPGLGNAAKKPAYLGWVIGIDPLGRCDGLIKRLGRPWKIVALGLRSRDAQWPSRGLDGGSLHLPLEPIL